jgi:hypothetical protein
MQQHLKRFLVGAAAIVATLAVGSTAAGADIPLPPKGDPVLTACVKAINNAPTDAQGLVTDMSQIPAECMASATDPTPGPTITDVKIHQATSGSGTTATTSTASTSGAAVSTTATAGVTSCATYQPPTVVLTPTRPKPGQLYTGNGYNWPANSHVFGYSIAYNSWGWPLFFGGVVLVQADANGRWTYTLPVDSRWADFYILWFSDIECPNAAYSFAAWLTPPWFAGTGAKIGSSSGSNGLLTNAGGVVESIGAKSGESAPLEASMLWMLLPLAVAGAGALRLRQGRRKALASLDI